MTRRDSADAFTPRVRAAPRACPTAVAPSITGSTADCTMPATRVSLHNPTHDSVVEVPFTASRFDTTGVQWLPFSRPMKEIQGFPGTIGSQKKPTLEEAPCNER